MIQGVFEKLLIYGPRSFSYFTLIEARRLLWDRALLGSYSQEGEDRLIDALLGHPATGWYVDVGANHPKRFSNTHRFFRRGWHGINIEPNVTLYQQFLVERPGDINVNCGIGEMAGELRFFSFFPDTLSTFSREKAQDYCKQGFRIVSEVPVAIKPLREVLDLHCRSEQIDFLSVDTEGLDLEVLRSNDWTRFRPRVICVETASSGEGLSEANSGEVRTFLESHGYSRACGTAVNDIYRCTRT